MKRLIDGEDRNRVTLLPRRLDANIGEDTIAVGYVVLADPVPFCLVKHHARPQRKSDGNGPVFPGSRLIPSGCPSSGQK